VRQLPLTPAVQRRNVEVVQVLEIIGDIRHLAGFFIDVVTMDAALTLRQRSNFAANHVHPENRVRSPIAGLEPQLIRSRPVQVLRNQIEMIDYQC
jgi:hypothetical protein